MQRDPYYNPMPQQDQGGWGFNPEPVDYSTQRQMGQGAIDTQQRNQGNLDRMYSMRGLWDTIPQVPGFMSEMVSGGMGNIGNMAGNVWDQWRNSQPDAVAQASPWGTQRDNFGWR